MGRRAEIAGIPIHLTQKAGRVIREKERERREKGNTKETSCIQPLQMVVNSVSRGATQRRDARGSAIECTHAGSAYPLNILLLSTRRRLPTQGAYRTLDKHLRSGHGTRCFTCSVAGGERPVWPHFCHSGRSRHALRLRLRSGT